MVISLPLERLVTSFQEIDVNRLYLHLYRLLAVIGDHDDSRMQGYDVGKMDLTRSGRHPRVWRQSLREGSPRAEEDRVALPGGVQSRSRPASSLLPRQVHPPARLRAGNRGPNPTQLDQASRDRPR